MGRYARRGPGALMGMVALFGALHACGFSGESASVDVTVDADVDGASLRDGALASDSPLPATDAARDGASDASDASDAALDADAAPTVAPFCQLGAPACLARLDIGGKTLPYYRSHPLGTANGALENLVLVMHGNNRNADSYFATVAGLAYARDPVHTLVVAPWIQTDPATGICVGTLDAPLANDLYWSCGGWKDGNASRNPGATITSYAAIDALVAAAKSSFPTIKRVTIVGYSAGGQVINRYIAGSTEEDNTPAVKTRFIVSSPGSYLYLDDQRLQATATCPDEGGCTVDATSFEAPYWDSATCPTYDDYKYGMVARTGYLKPIATATLKARYLSRDVIYILSEKDSGAIPGAAFGELDVDCEAIAQGPVGYSFRLQRGLVYHRYVTQLLGAAHRVAVVPLCGHDHVCVLGTTLAQDEMFGP